MTGARRGIRYFVEKFHEHPAITSSAYAEGLIDSWKEGESDLFPFLLVQADQDDLKEVKKDCRCKADPEFSKIVSDALSKAEPAGGRHKKRESSQACHRDN